MSLAHTAHLKVCIEQLDYIGAFLQANVWSHVFIKFPTIYSEIIDILHLIADCRLTPNSAFPFYIIFVDVFSCFFTIYGLSDNPLTV
jgi:hypothetical protein